MDGGGSVCVDMLRDVAGRCDVYGVRVAGGCMEESRIGSGVRIPNQCWRVVLARLYLYIENSSMWSDVSILMPWRRLAIRVVWAACRSNVELLSRRPSIASMTAAM